METGRQRQFHIHHCLGRGGYGEVYRATMVAPGGIENDVAVKLLRVDLDPGAEAVRRLRDEGRLLSVLRHPAILRVFDLALLDGRIGLVTEFVDGEDLSTLVGVLPLRATLEVAGAVGEALDAAWNHPRADGRPLHLVHRDIKPSNIRIGRHGEVKILDFGIARSMDEQADRLSRTGTGSTVGSLAYMAPERFARSPSTPAGDVYGLGCTLYECLSGFRLFEDPVPVEMFRLAADERQYQQHLDKAMVRLDPALAPELLTLLRDMLAYSPTARPSPAEIEARCATLTEAMAGPSLRTWARERAWPARPFVPGHLEGRVITEGTLSSTESGNIAQDDRSSDTVRIELLTGGIQEPAVASSKEALAPVRGWPRLPVLALWGLTLLALFAIAVQLSRERVHPSGPVTPVPAAVAPVPVAPVPVAPEPVVPVPVEPVPVVPEPVAPVPAESLPEPAPAIAAPAPRRPPPQPVVPEPEIEIETVLPAPIELPVPEVRYGRVVVIPNNVRIELHGPDRLYPPGRVPVGRYELFADFGYGTTNIGRYVDVLDGYETTVRCNTLRHQCDVDR